MLRVRFKIADDDYRPVIWPIKHPYWCSGESDTHHILVAYVDDLDEVMVNWPDAEEIDVMEENVREYHFTARFARPSWFKG